MSLQNWFDNGYLKKANPTPRDIAAKFSVAERNLKAFSLEGLPEDIGFRLAYEAMLVVAQALLLAEGYRTGTPGSHYYTIESLEFTLGESRKKLILLQAMAKKRHVAQYDMQGAVSPQELEVMLKEARRIMRLGIAMLMAKHPELC